MINRLNKIFLTSMIALGGSGIFGNANGQDKNLENILKEIKIYREMCDSLQNNISHFKTLFLNYSKLIENRTKKIHNSAKRVYSDSLCINPNDKIYYVTKKNEKRGINDLIKICNDGLEETWLYLPEKQIWYEIGIFADSISVQPFKFRVEKVLEENKDVKKLIFYHNHPTEGYERPSDMDLYEFFFKNLHFPNHNLVGKIVGNGVGEKNYLIKYSLNCKGKKLLNDKDILIDEVEYTGFYFPEHISRYFDINLKKINKK